eukprot:TRINITY_DN7059_c0_g1_i2.p1 TRINITY_DN7059_c0_g1~~TRINITY_DN7059_c0_g1_i2.p1  ORF type:complete len:623 (-),score=105.11 TRINITY_DN7059_c0_g1_i2:1434-3239(-)
MSSHGGATAASGNVVVSPSPASSVAATVAHLLQEAKSRWLKGFEVLCLLQHFHLSGRDISVSPVADPPSGSLFFFNKKSKFRNDGIQWKKQKDGKTVRESHEKLKVGGINALTCCYATCEDRPSLHRRTYWMLAPEIPTVAGVEPKVAVHGAPMLALVHYLDEAITSSNFSGMSPSIVKCCDVPPTVRAVSTLSPGAHTSRTPTIAQVKTEVADTASTGSTECWPPHDNVFEPHGHARLGIELPDFNSCSPPALEGLPSLSPKGSSPSDSGGGSPLHFSYENVFESFDVLPVLGLDSSAMDVSELDPTDAAADDRTQLAPISDYTPDWDYVDGGAKLLLTAPHFQQYDGLSYCCVFDETPVPATLVQQGILRCFVPARATDGIVGLYVTLGDGIVFSQVQRFEYRKRPDDPSSSLAILRRLEALERHVHHQQQRQQLVSSFDSTGADSHARDVLAGPAAQFFPQALFEARLSTLESAFRELAIEHAADAEDQVEQNLADLSVSERVAVHRPSISAESADRPGSHDSGGKIDTREAARRIARYYKTYRERFRRKVESAAIKVQSRLRMKLAMRQAREKRRKENEAAMKIQSAFKRYHSREML